MSGPVVVVEFHIEPAEIDRWRQTALTYLETCVAEAGMEFFWVHQDEADPSRFLFYEQWSSTEHYEASLRASWREPYLRDTRPAWRSARTVRLFRRVPAPWEAGVSADQLPIEVNR